MTHIGQNNMQGNYKIFNQELRTTDLSRNHHHERPQVAKTIKKEKSWELLGFIARNYNYKDKELVLKLYKSLFCPNLEYTAQFWSPHLRLDIDEMEKGQRRATKMILEIRTHSYQQRIQYLKLFNLA